MKRIIVMGPPGSGKSTLARQLGARHDLPVFHLDQAYWQAGWVETAPDAFRSEVERIAALPAWIMDGNYTGSIGPRLQAADTVIYLDISTVRCMYRILRRTLSYMGTVRADAAPGCPERLDIGFLHFAWNWNRKSRTRNLALIQNFAGRKIILRSNEGGLQEAGCC